MVKTVFRRITKDLWDNRTLITAIAIMWILAELIFHRFCPVVIVSGFPCPGCGLTRALFHLITMHPIKALEYNPSYPFWVALAIAFVIRRYVQGKDLKVLRYPVMAVCIITIGIYVWRMTALFPGKEPMVFFEESVFGRVMPFYNEFVKKIAIQ